MHVALEQPGPPSLGSAENSNGFGCDCLACASGLCWFRPHNRLRRLGLRLVPPQTLVKLDMLSGDGVPAIGRGHGPCGFTHPSSQCPVSQQAVQRGRQVPGRLRRHQQAGPAVLNQLLHAGQHGGDDRPTRRVTFQHDQTERFKSPRWYDDDAGVLQQPNLGLTGRCTQKPDAVRQSRGGGLGFERPALIALARDHQFNAAPGPQKSQRRQQVVNPLARVQAADEQREFVGADRRVQPVGTSDRLRVESRVHAVGNADDVSRRRTQPRESRRACSR